MLKKLNHKINPSQLINYLYSIFTIFIKIIFYIGLTAKGTSDLNVVVRILIML